MIRIHTWPVVVLTAALTVGACFEVRPTIEVRGDTPTSVRTVSRTSSGWLEGKWFAHTLGLTVDRAGHARITWRTYAVCGEDPPPCDTFRGGEIVDGGTATGIFTDIDRTTASGRVLTSTDPAGLPVGPITLRFDPGHDVLSMRPSPRGPSPLCGPHPVSVVCG